jgi:hypothetical protein
VFRPWQASEPVLGAGHGGSLCRAAGAITAAGPALARLDLDQRRREAALPSMRRPSLERRCRVPARARFARVPRRRAFAP